MNEIQTRRFVRAVSTTITIVFLFMMLYAWAHFSIIESEYRRQAGGVVTNLPLYEKMHSLAIGGLVISGTLLFFLFLIRAGTEYVSAVRQQEEKIESLERKVDAEPEKVRPAWDLARVKLEAYFDRNLKQVQAIFIVAIFVMLVGFGLVVWGVRISIFDPSRLSIAVIASASGVITEFVSLTFMAIYKATMAQANQFVAVLERINTVGMAVQILDSMEKESPEIKDTTRVEMIKLLLAVPSVSQRETRRKSETQAAVAK